MARRNECPFFDNCGYVKWRANRTDANAAPMLEDDCGISTETCGRLNPEVPIDVDKFGPQLRSELDLAYPRLENNHGRPKRSLIGGCHR